MWLKNASPPQFLLLYLCIDMCPGEMWMLLLLLSTKFGNFYTWLIAKQEGKKK